MLVRVRGAGASAANSQALVMNLRGAKMNAKARPADSYPLQPLSAAVGATNGTVRQEALTAALLRVLDRFTVFRMAIDTDGATAGAVWRELHNLYDISHDEDDDADLANPIGSASLLLQQQQAPVPTTTVDRRIVLPLHSFFKKTTPTAPDVSAAAENPTTASSVAVVYLLPADGTAQAALSMRRALTMLAFALWRFPSAAAVVLVVPDAALGTDYEGVLAASWAVASGALDALADDEAAVAAGGTAAVLRSLVDRLTAPASTTLALRIVGASSAEAAAASAKAAAVVVVPNADMASAVAGVSAGEGTGAPLVVDASTWVDGEPADDDGPRFDMTAANAERMREGARENFCPCCGHCSSSPHE